VDAASGREPDYVGDEVQIGGGFGGMKPLAQHGWVVIADGVLTLYGSKGDVIDQAHLVQVEVKKARVTMGQSVYVTLNGTRYSVSVGHGARQLGPIGGGAAQMGDSRAGTSGFVAAFEALSGKTV